jgi:hypothetical protein
MLMAVMTAGATYAAAAMLLLGNSGGPSGPVEATPSERAEPGSPLRIELAPVEDSRWELTGIDILLDGQPLAAPAPASEPAEPAQGARPVWSGVVAPGPHNLAALLTFRPRNPGRDAIGPSRTIRIETEHRFPARPIRPLVLLITPVRPAPAAGDLLLTRFTLAPPPGDPPVQ